MVVFVASMVWVLSVAMDPAQSIAPSCPPDMASDIGTPIAMGVMEAWRRGDSGEQYWFKGQPDSLWFDYTDGASVREVEYVRSGCLKHMGFFMIRHRTWHAFRATIGYPDRDPRQELVVVVTWSREGGWKAQTIAVVAESIQHVISPDFRGAQERAL
jgi:hypothetical protein